MRYKIEERRKKLFMSKKIRLLLVPLFILAALCVIPTVVSAAPKNSNNANGTKTVSYAVAGLNKTTSAPIVGGLTISIRNTGYFNGNFISPESTQTSVSGKVESKGKITITFYTREGKPFIKGQGTGSIGSGYTGPFQVFDKNKKQIATGLWRAVPVANPDSIKAMAFAGEIVKGAHTGLLLSGPIILNKSTWKGYLYAQNGTNVPVTATFSNGNKSIKLVFYGGVTATGKLVDNSFNRLNKGYTGTLSGPARNDQGKWAAFYTHF
jgi:hypothetical protein